VPPSHQILATPLAT